MTMRQANYIPTIPEDETQVGSQTVSEKEQAPVTLRDLPPPGELFQRKITDREITALKQLGPLSVNLLNEAAKDIFPVWGEARAMDYTAQEVEGLKKAVAEKDVGGTIAHGIGVPIMSAASLPWWLGGAAGVGVGYAYRKGIAQTYRNLTSRWRKPVLAEAPLTQARRGYLSEIEVAKLGGGEERSAYIQWMRGLPENRMSGTEQMINTNLDEFFSSVVPNADLMADLTATYRSTVSGAGKINNYKAKKNALLDARKESESVIEQGSLPDKITENLNYGESGTPIRVGPQKNVSEFLGSNAYDVIAKENFKGMNTNHITARLINLVKSGKINKEELFDAGILKLDENFKPVGGSLADMPKEFKDIQVTKQDLLKMIKNAPSQRLKISNYGTGTTQVGDEFYDLYASTDRMGNNLLAILERKIFQETDTTKRAAMITVKNKIKNLEGGATRVANAGEGKAGWGVLDMENLTANLPAMPLEVQQILRGYISNIQKLRPYVDNSIKRSQASGFKNKTKHDKDTYRGGDDYQEKTIYLDESIPLNKDKGKAVFSGHFPDPNPIAHIRTTVRYDSSGQPIRAVEELQSDTLQKMWGGETKVDKELAKKMRKTMNNPYGKTLVEAIIKRKMKELNDLQTPLLNASRKRSLTDLELKELKKIDSEKSFLRKYFVRSELMDEQSLGKMGQIVQKSIGDHPNYFPYMRSYDQVSLKAIVDDAIRSGQRGVTIMPVIKGKHYSGGGGTGVEAEKGHHMYYGDTKGTKLGALEQVALSGKNKSAADAVYVATLKKIAKQIEKDHGIKLTIKRKKIYSTKTDKSRPYQIINDNGDVVASFNTKVNRDYILDKKNAAEPQHNFTKRNLEDITKEPAHDFFAMVLEIPEDAARKLLKKKMRSYKVGGLVAIQPKREYFASIF